MIRFLFQDFTLLDDKKDRLLLVLICLVFSVIFVNLFVPFNINRWYSDSGIIKFLRLSSYGVIVSAVLSVSQFPVRNALRIRKMKVYTFLIWFSCEIIFTSLVYILLYGNIIGNFINDLIFSLKYTFLGICLPYSFSLGIIYYKKQEKEILRLTRDTTKGLISFRSETGKINFSMQKSDILYIESLDNYTSVYYLSDGKTQRKVLRNSLKNLEEILSQKGFIRCHRSFLINSQNIDLVNRESGKISIKLKGSDRLFTVSRKYLPLIYGHLS